MQAVVGCVRSSLQGKRNEESFQTLFEKATGMVDSLNVDPIEMPRSRQPPSRHTGAADAHTAKSLVEHYRAEYYKVLDMADTQFRDRFDQDGLTILEKLENALLTGELDGAIIDQYPELNRVS